MDPNAVLQVYHPRRIAHVLKLKVKEELHRMVREKVIIKVRKPTALVNPIVVIEKTQLKSQNMFGSERHGSVREHYPMKRVEDVAAILQNANVFNTLDFALGFHQIKLTEESIWVTTFVTPYGRYKFKRLPFGISNERFRNIFLCLWMQYYY